MNFLKFLPKKIKQYFSTVKTDSVHDAVLGTLVQVLENVEDAVVKLVLELHITTSTGLWLEEWGRWFGCYRKPGEIDETLRERILQALTSPKVTVLAIKQVVLDYLLSHGSKDITTDDVIIFEPYTLLKRFSSPTGELSSRFVFPSEFYRYNVIEVQVPGNLTEDLILKVKKVIAAGVLVNFVVIRPPGEQDIVPEGHCDSVLVNTVVSTTKDMFCHYPMDGEILSGRSPSGKSYLSGGYEFNATNIHRHWMLSNIGEDRIYSPYTLVRLADMNNLANEPWEKSRLIEFNPSHNQRISTGDTSLWYSEDSGEFFELTFDEPKIADDNAYYSKNGELKQIYYNQGSTLKPVKIKQN